MNICRVPRKWTGPIVQEIAFGLAVCGTCAVIVGIAAAILGAPVASHAAQAVYSTAQGLIAGYAIRFIFERYIFKIR